MANPELTQTPSMLDKAAKAVARAVSFDTQERTSATRKMAMGLGWFSIGLGLLELIATRRLARSIGMQGRETTLEAYGLREIASGIAILMLPDTKAKSVGMWSRVAGDALDLATLGTAALRSNGRGGHPFAAIAAVAGVTALDLACARTLGQEADAEQQTTDYSDRAGLPSPPDSMRGAALKNFTQPPDMRLSPQRNTGTAAPESGADATRPASIA